MSLVRQKTWIPDQVRVTRKTPAPSARRTPGSQRRPGRGTHTGASPGHPCSPLTEHGPRSHGGRQAWRFLGSRQPQRRQLHGRVRASGLVPLATLRLTAPLAPAHCPPLPRRPPTLVVRPALQPGPSLSPDSLPSGLLLKRQPLRGSILNPTSHSTSTD